MNKSFPGVEEEPESRCDNLIKEIANILSVNPKDIGTAKLSKERWLADVFVGRDEYKAISNSELNSLKELRNECSRRKK